MKLFFIPLDFSYGRPSDPCSPLGFVYGPYENDEAVEEAIARIWPNDKKRQFLVFEGQIVKVKPSTKEKPEYEKREPGDMANYIKDNGGYKCKDCGGVIIDVDVKYPIHIHHTPGAGFGKCQYKTVFYCPNCEKRPNSYGDPIYV